MSGVLKTILVNYIICGILGGVLGSLTPESSKKTMKFIVTVIVTALCVTPLFNLNLNFDKFTYSFETKEIKNESLEHIKNLTSKKTYEEIEKILINEGLTEYEINVETDVSNDGKTVFIKKIEIFLLKAYKGKISKIKSLIPEEYKSITEIGVKNE